MDNYIKCYDNVVTDEFCENAVTKFEGDYTQHEQWPKNNTFFTQIPKSLFFIRFSTISAFKWKKYNE